MHCFLRVRLYLACLISLFSLDVSALVVLQYHHVSDKTPRSTSISPQLFKAHMDYIASAGYQVVDVKQLKAWLKNHERLPDKSVVITFDDGYRSVLANAFPLLKARQWPFTVFVNSKAHDEKNPHYMSWDELRMLSRQGGTIANHTDSHAHLIRKRSHESRESWKRRRTLEVEYAEKRIKKEIGVSHKLFAYPFGEYDEALQTYLKAQGYIAFGQHSGPVSPEVNRQSVPRFPFGGDYGTIDDFAVKLASLPFPKITLRTTTESGKVLNEPLLPLGEAQPILRIASPLFHYIRGPKCFASGMGEIPAEIKGGALVAQAHKRLSAGRSRYNCTAPAGGGRFYWFSQLFIQRLPNGDWVKE